MSTDKPMEKVRDAQLYKTSETWRLEWWLTTDNVETFRFVMEGPRQAMEPIVKHYEENKIEFRVQRTDKLTFTPIS